MKILFMGTPDYAAAALEALIQAGHEIVAVATQPDKAKGRSKTLQFSPVKETALKYGISILQPEKIKTAESVEILKEYKADVFVVAAFGQILSAEILNMPKFGSINIHASLLPKYRGASPIQNVILDGETKTGITIIQMDEGIDTGAMLYKKELFIEETDTTATLYDKLKVLGGEAIVEAMELLEKNELVATNQNHEEASYVKMITKEMGKIDFSKSALEINRLVRGMNPWPSAFTTFRGKQLKIWETKVVWEECLENPGTIIEVTKEYIKVATGSGALLLLSLQLEGKKRMSCRDFLLGVKVEQGEVLCI